MPDTPLRGRRGRDRRIAERVATDFAARHAPTPPGGRGRLRRRGGRRRGRGRPARAAEAAADRRGQGRDHGRREPGRKPGGHRLPDLSALPPLLAATGTFAALRERLGRAEDDPRRTGRHVGLVSVPHGAKTLPRRDPRPGGRRRAPRLDRPRRGDRRSRRRGARRLARRPGGRRRPRAADGAGLRAQRADRRRDGRPGRGPRRVAERSGADPRGERPGAPPAHDRPGRPAGRAARAAGRRRGSARTPSCASCSTSATCRSARSPAGASSRAAAGSSTSSRRRWRSRSGSSSSATRSTRCARSTRPTSARRARSTAPSSCPRPSSCSPPGGAAAIRDRLGRAAARLPERLAADLARFDAEPLEVAARRGRRAGRWPSVTPPRSGPPTSPRRPASTTSVRAPCSSSTSPATSPRPPTSCGARPTSAARSWSRPASCRRTGRRPICRPATGRAASSPRGPSSSPGSRCRPRTSRWPAAALSSGDPFGWREPVLPPGRAGRLVEAVEAWRADDARIVLASDQAPRLADLLGEAGHPVAVVGRVGEAPPPGAIALIERSLNGGFIGGPDGLAFVTDRELFGTVRIRRPKALRRVVPRDILERLTTGRPRRPHRPRRRALRADAAARRRRRGARLPRALVRRRRPDLRPGRADRPGHALLGRRAPGALQARRHGVAAGEAAGPQGGRRPGRGAARAVRVARRRPGSRVRSRHAVAGARWRRRSRTRRPSTSCAPRPRSRPTWS